MSSFYAIYEVGFYELSEGLSLRSRIMKLAKNLPMMQKQRKEEALPKCGMVGYSYFCSFVG